MEEISTEHLDCSEISEIRVQSSVSSCLVHVEIPFGLNCFVNDSPNVSLGVRVYLPSVL